MSESSRWHRAWWGQLQVTLTAGHSTTPSSFTCTITQGALSSVVVLAAPLAGCRPQPAENASPRDVSMALPALPGAALQHRPHAHRENWQQLWHLHGRRWWKWGWEKVKRKIEAEHHKATPLFDIPKGSVRQTLSTVRGLLPRFAPNVYS